MTNVKGFFESKTIWGGLIAFGAGVAGLLGYAVSDADAEQLVAYITGGAATAGGIYAIYGRIKASKQVKLGG